MRETDHAANQRRRSGVMHQGRDEPAIDLAATVGPWHWHQRGFDPRYRDLPTFTSLAASRRGPLPAVVRQLVVRQMRLGLSGLRAIRKQRSHEGPLVSDYAAAVVADAIGRNEGRVGPEACPVFFIGGKVFETE